MSTDSERDQSTDRILRKAALRRPDKVEGEACLDAEAFAAWAEGALPEAEAVQVEAHLADCARCQSMMASFAASEPAAATPAAPVVLPFRTKSPLRWLIPVAAGTAAASLLIWTAWPKPAASDVPAGQTMARADAAVPAPMPQAQREQSAAVPQAKAEAAPGAQSKLADEARAAGKRATARQQTSRMARGAGVKPSPSPSAAPATAPLPGGPPPAVMPVPIPPPAIQGQVVRTEPPTVSQTASADFIQKLPRADRNAPNFLTFVPGTVEFGPADSQRALDRTSSAAGGMGRGGGAAAAAERATPPGNIRWRILPTGEVGKSTDAGATWTPIALEPTVPIVNGAAPSAAVCWLIGRSGVVLLSTDGTKFTRVPFPEPVDLRSITAIDARQATISTVDGRTFTTTDAGQTWKSRRG